MNILLTDVCNRKCEFCFAQDVHEHKGMKFMPMENVDKVLAFIKKSEMPDFHCIGGEPSLHPKFIDIAKKIHASGLFLHLFSNGSMLESKTDQLAELFPDGLGFGVLCNVTKTTTDTDRILEMRHYFLKRLGKYVSVSLTINSPIFDHDYVFDLIDKYELHKNIRVGVAHPILGSDGSAHLKKELFRAFGITLSIFRERALKLGLKVNPDCGMVHCMGWGTRHTCTPILDVGVDLSVWSCFPLSQMHRVHLDDFKNRTALVKYFKEVLSKAKKQPLFPHCAECEHQPVCDGGCLAHRITL